MLKIFNGYDSYSCIQTQLGALSLKVSSHVDHICRSEEIKVTKNAQKLTNIDLSNTFAPRNPSKRSQVTFFF